MRGWHFLRADMRLSYGDGRLVVPGETLQQPDMSRDPVLCKYGMHASARILDALRYAPGPVICRVEIPDAIVGDAKFVGRERTCLWMVDAAVVLHEFAFRCAEDALALIDKPDPRSIAVIAAKRAWMRGKISDSELDAAGAAAWDAAWDAARAARAARGAARGAAWAAARAARGAAWAAARGAGAAARGAARAAAWGSQNRRLTSMVIAEAKRQGVYV